MKTLTISCIAILFGVIAIFVSEMGEQFSIPWTQSLVPTVEARVGRPLTPVSVAGAARRTVRRCAVGVYNCSIPGGHSLDGQLGLVRSGEPRGKEQAAAEG